MNLGRINSIDVLRGLAIILVVFYHLLFDLDYFGFLVVNFKAWPMLIFEFLIQFVFLSLVGISMFIVFKRKSYEDFVKFQTRRFFILMFWALVITGVSYFIFAETYIRFGVLHLIAASIFIISLLAPYKCVQWFVFLFVLFATVYLKKSGIEVDGEYLLSLGLRSSTFESVDYFPLIPWFLVPLLGFMFGDFWLKIFKWIDKYLGNEKLISWIGKRTLLIYLVHQPVLFGLFWIVKSL